MPTISERAGELFLQLASIFGSALFFLALQITGLYDAALVAWMPGQYAAVLLNPRYHAMPLLVPLVVAGLILRARLLSRARAAKATQEDNLRRPKNTSLFQRLRWRFRKPVDVMSVDGLSVDRTRRPHCAWLGPTGAGKSAGLSSVRINGERPTLVVTPDPSDPIHAAGLRLQKYFHWRACQSEGIPVDFLIGSPTEVAERLTEVFRSGGVGAWKRAARRATASVVREIDKAGDRRSLHAIGVGLQASIKSDRELRTACQGWVERFLDLADQFGTSIASGGVDLAELLNDGYTILLDNDGFDHPALGEDVVALGLAEAKRCAALVPDGFRLVFEEAGQLGERVDLAYPFFRAGRRRKICVDVLTQAESDLKFHGSDAITSNIATWVYFAQEQVDLQKAAADRLGLKHTELDPARMKDFTAYVRHGRIRRLVRFPKPPKAKNAPVSARIRSPFEEEIDVADTPARIQIIELRRDESLRALPAPQGLSAEIAAGIYRDGECERWRGSHLKDKKGLPTYGRVFISGVGWKYIHRARWELAYGPLGLDELGQPLTIDHRRTCFKDCSRLDHLEAVSRSENSQRRWRVRGIGTPSS